MSEQPIKFGTDGWRAVIGEGFTFANLRACAQGVASYVVESGLAGRGLVVGYDTRFVAGEFAADVAEVLAANGIGVYLCPRPVPTPVVGYAILERKTAGAVVITASHNPAQYQGFKFRSEYGGSAPPEVLAQTGHRRAHPPAQPLRHRPGGPRRPHPGVPGEAEAAPLDKRRHLRPIAPVLRPPPR